MAKYRKKPVVIEAHLWDGNSTKFPPWLDEAVIADRVELAGSGSDDMVLEIKTLEGTMIANLGDWIIKGAAGELYPCRPDIFEATYESVEEQA